MVSIKLKPHQTIHQFIELMEAWRRFNDIRETYTIEFGGPTRYLVEPADKRMTLWIRDNVECNAIHQNDSRQ